MRSAIVFTKFTLASAIFSDVYPVLVAASLPTVFIAARAKIVNDRVRVTWDSFAVNFFEHFKSGCRAELPSGLSENGPGIMRAGC
jgi:hypothetical protein